MTLEEWAAKQPYKLGTLLDKRWMHDSVDLVDRSEAWCLDDYLVHSVAAGVIWFSPRELGFHVSD